MKVTVNGHLYTIGWYYESKLINKLCSKYNISHEEIKGLKKKQICEKLGLKAFPLPDRTHCVITRDDGREYRRSVRRDSRDPWNREEARRRSFEKALWDINPEAQHGDKKQRDMRTQFWDKYNNRRVYDPIANINKCMRHGIFTKDDLRKFMEDDLSKYMVSQKSFQIH